MFKPSVAMRHAPAPVAGRVAAAARATPQILAILLVFSVLAAVEGGTAGGQGGNGGVGLHSLLSTGDTVVDGRVSTSPAAPRALPSSKTVFPSNDWCLARGVAVRPPRDPPCLPLYPASQWAWATGPRLP